MKKKNSELVVSVLWEKINKTEEELVIEREHAKDIDNWYQTLLEKEKKVGEITEKQRDNLKEQVRQLQKKLEDLQIKENRIEILPENS